MKIAFQGTKGSYSEEALYKYFGNDVTAIGFELSEQVFESVRDGEAFAAVLPVENSIVGNVSVNTDLFYVHDVYAVGEIYLPIKHSLLTLPGTELSEIEKVYSHPVALNQCRDFITRHGIEAIASADTAGSAKALSKKKTKNTGVIASSFCSDHYGLKVVESNIQKVQNNITRFLVVVLKENVDEAVKQEKVSIILRTTHKPGALLNCLQKFSDHGVNLTKLESRPVPENPFSYVFYIDFLGALSDENVASCLSEIETSSELLKVIGAYPKA